MKSKLSHVQVIAFGYILMILIGTLLLMLPFASADGQCAPFQTAAFTATSASCVTGLILRDTATAWTPFGQAVILLLIQVGGLGFMTIATLFFLAAGKRMGLRSREIMVESINTTKIGGLMKLTKTILLGTLCFEGTGALLLAIRFVPTFGWGKGIWYSMFHAISAFCNAGFDLLGVREPFCSLVPYYNDWLVNLVVMALIVLGGLGFLVWEDLLRCGLHFKRYRLHTKLVLSASAILIFGGALLFWLFEANATGAELTQGERILTALFASVTCRTAGFNTIDPAAMTDASKLLSVLLMIIGGSPGSTAGGVKTVTFAVIALYTVAAFRGMSAPTVFGRRITAETLRKSVNVLFINVSLLLIAAIAICAIQPLPLVDVLFETASAMGTVGITTGITRDLTAASAWIITLLMYLGRVGSVTFAVALLEKRAKPPVSYPTEEITVG